jgi:two-component system, response regulator PdtaR
MSTLASPLRIAVADDERDMREFLQESLSRLGHQVVGTAATGRQLADLCHRASPDLIITDIKMPDMDGIQAAEAFNREKETPIILVSGHYDDELAARAGSHHVMAYLIKPVKEPDLRAAINLSQMRFQHYQAVAREAASLRQALEDRKVIERAKGVLMKRGELDEPEAFRRLQKLASDKNRKMLEIAQMILTVEEAFQPPERR